MDKDKQTEDTDRGAYGISKDEVNVILNNAALLHRLRRKPSECPESSTFLRAVRLTRD